MVFIFMIKTYTEMLIQYCVAQQLTVFTVIIEICIIHRSRTMTVKITTYSLYSSCYETHKIMLLPM